MYCKINSNIIKKFRLSKNSQKIIMENKTKEIDLIELFYKLKKEKKLIVTILVLTSLCGLIVSYSLPKKYTVNVTLSPESDFTANNMSGMASMLGISGMGNTNQDALTPTMFPDIIKSTPFILEMYNIEVKPQNFENNIPLFQYVTQQKEPWWNHIFKIPNIAINGIKSLFKQKEIQKEKTYIDPYRLTGYENGNIALIKSTLSVSENKKNGMTIISATLQDPEVAAAVADSAVNKLQRYIINYRIRKAQDDCNYLEKLCKDRKNEYLKAQQIYADFMDANRNVVLQRTQAEGTRLQNDMSIAFQVYSQVETQLQVARAKVQEAKPVFAIVEPASVPLGPSSPNKPLIIIAFMFLGFIGSSLWILFGKNLWNNIRAHKKN